MAKQIFVSKEEYQKLENELEHLKTVKRKEVAMAIQKARSFGDLSENSEYDEAKNDQALLEARIAELNTRFGKNLMLLTMDAPLVQLGRYPYAESGEEQPVLWRVLRVEGSLVTLLSEKVQNVLGFGDHGSTFGGNPVCCAGALSILRRIDDALLADVKKKGEYIRQQLEGAKGIKGISGMGLMVGIQTEKPAGQLVKALVEKGVLCLTAKDKVRLLPALNIPMDVLAKAIDAVKEVCAE